MITPVELAQSFNKGLESGAPFSSAAHAVPPVSMTSSEPQMSHAPTTVAPAIASPQVHVPVFDSPQPAHHAPVPEAPAAPPIVAAAPPVSAPVHLRPLAHCRTTVRTYGPRFQQPSRLPRHLARPQCQRHRAQHL